MKKLLLTVVPILAILGLLFIGKFIEPETVKLFLEGFGPWTVIIFVLAYFVAVWIPHVATILTIVAGLLFGPVLATVLVIFLSTFASILPFLFARKIATARTYAWLTKKGYDKYAHKVNKNSFLYVLYLRLLPLLPYELQNYLIGLTNISVKNFVLATFVGLLPGTLALALLGDTIANTSTHNIIILGIVTLLAALIPFLVKRYGNTAEVLEA
jgi:uncharacterized membrane protein YdjX (TVP38/TMEM64 family)